MKSWYLIHCKPRQECVAKENLNRQGYETYLPIAPVRRRRRGRSHTVQEPMFPRYLFIHLVDGVDDWGPIRSTLGVSKLVKFGQIAARVSDHLISSLIQREDENGIQIIPSKPLKKGEKIRIAEGPFEGYEGIFQAESGNERVVVLMGILESQARLEIEQNKIEVIS